MAEVIDVVERVARAIYRQLGGGSGDYDDAARAAFAAMLEAVGEPVAWIYERWQGYGGTALSSARWQPKLGFSETPLYSLAAFREAPPQD